MVDKSLGKSVASVITPPAMRSANLPAISLPRADEATKIASGFSLATTWANAETAAAIPCFEISSFSTTINRSISVPDSCAASASPAPLLARITPIALPARFAKVANSPGVLATFEPS